MMMRVLSNLKYQFAIENQVSSTSCGVALAGSDPARNARARKAVKRFMRSPLRGGSVRCASMSRRRRRRGRGIKLQDGVLAQGGKHGEWAVPAKRAASAA